MIVPSELHVAAGLLFDILVLAGGPASRLSPLCNETPKAVLPLCHKPLIWHCLRPWVEKGVRTFFVCVLQQESPAIVDKLKRSFHGVNFIFVELIDAAATTTSDAVKQYLQVKAKLLPETEGRPRDLLLLSCDTLLPGVDVAPFISHFYTSRASVSVMMGKPSAVTAPVAPTPAEGGGGAKKGGKGGKKKGNAEEPLATCASLEEPVWTMTSPEAPESSKSSLLSSSSADGSPDHHRLHFIEQELVEDVSAGFIARRPNITIRRDLVDLHVYLMRDWVAKFIADTCEPERGVMEEVIPQLARSQFWSYSAESEHAVGPDTKLNYEKKVPQHWSTSCDSTRSIRSLNAMQGISPRPWDSLRVMCTVYPQTANQQLMRVNSREKFLAVAREIIHTLAAMKGIGFSGAAASSAPASLSQRNILAAQALEIASEEWSALLATSDNPHLPSRIRASLLRSLPTHDKVLISRSFVGQNVVLGEGITIEGSVVMDGAEIGNNAKIVNSVVCARCIIPEGATIVDAFKADDWKGLK